MIKKLITFLVTILFLTLTSISIDVYLGGAHNSTFIKEPNSLGEAFNNFNQYVIESVVIIGIGVFVFYYLKKDK